MCNRSHYTSLASFLVACLVYLASSTSLAASQLNGLALHQELGNEQFIGALYLEATSGEANSVVGGDQSKRMELRILADNGITARRFSRMWIEGMAINNSNAALTEQADNMVRFSNLFRGRLRQNDIIAFSREPGEGVTIEMNGVMLGEIENDSFFDLLLRSWVGGVPLSSSFKEGILAAGDPDSDLVTRFEAIEPSQAQVDRVVAWTQPEPEPEQTVSAGLPATELPKVTALDMPSARLQLDSDFGDTPDEEQGQEQAAEGSSSEAGDDTSEDAQLADSETGPEADSEQTAALEDEEEDAGPLLTAESLRAQQVYFSSLMRKILQNTQYPQRALRRGREGELRMAVVIDRQGRVKSMDFLEQARFSSLNAEAERAIQAASPFPSVPEAIQGDDYEFSVPFTFIIPDR